MPVSDCTTPLPLADTDTGAALCVLASGSGGNCSVLLLKRNGISRVILIDLGLSPRRTFKLLAERGLRPDQIDDAIVTHLDTDHFQPTWLGRSGLPPHARLRMHERHARELWNRDWGVGIRDSMEERADPSLPESRLPIPDSRPSSPRLIPFTKDFPLDDGVHVRPLLMSHDEDGVATFRIDMPGLGAGSLGFCTDLGRVTADLVDHMLADHGHGPGIDVLAMESNYCPKMQIESPRPPQLKARIMGGRGHLSNQEALEAIHAVRPREHVVLLHLSRQCNHPSLVADMHAGADYALTITSQSEPTRWVRIAPSAANKPAPVVSTRIAMTRTLWNA